MNDARSHNAERQARTRTTNGFAIASLVLGIVWAIDTVPDGYSVLRMASI